MKDMDYELVTKRLMSHVVENKFPPTIAEISAYASKENTYLKELEHRHEKAEEVPQHIKDDFREKFEELVRKRSK